MYVSDPSFAAKRVSNVVVAAQDVLLQKFNIIANDLANADQTPGHKSAELLTTQIIQQCPDGTEVSYPQASSVVYNFEQGPLKQTGMSTHMALNGRGFFKIKSDNGTTSYTRNGEFHINNEGYLVTGADLFVLSDKGDKISLPADGHISIDDTGNISVGKNIINKIGIANFENLASLTPEGKCLFKTQSPEKSSEAQVAQGAIELSNVSIMMKLVSLMETERLYVSLQKSWDEYEKQLSATINIKPQST